MTALSGSPASTLGPMITRVASRTWEVSPGLSLLTFVNIFVLVASIVGRFVDEATFNGVSVWDKPAKFALSFLAFAPMMLWLFSKVESTKIIRWGLGVLGWSMIVEISLIVLQAVSGTTSHFNKATFFDGAVYRGMTAGVGIFAIAAIVTGLVLARKNLGPTALGLATKLAVAMMTAGALLGNTMTTRKPHQVAGSDAVGGHAVGGPDGGPGLPFLGWSTELGDLRVAHFFGLHALQIVPAIAIGVMWLSDRRTFNLNNKGQRTITSLGALSYGGIVLTTLVQAIRGIPVTEPDRNTLAMLVIFVGIPAAAALVLAARPSPTLQAGAANEHLRPVDASSSTANRAEVL